MEQCPKCGSRFIQWSSYHQRFECLIKDCQHSWTLESTEGWKLESPVKNIYLRTTLPLEMLRD